ncbi:MAG TPA: amidohydrolase family protein [Vicinamibacteria bacterium]|nr:amidohydrolase family protein [Vicinamibacteria bacterium]
MKAAALLLALAATAPGAGAQDAPSFAIVGARVVPVSGPVLEKATVLVSGGRITAVGAEVAVPEGVETIDAAGQTLYPGLIDALTVLGLTEIGSVPGSVDVSEVGDVNPQARAWVALQPHSDLIPVARANGVTAALAAPGGGLISGQSALIRLAGTTPAELVIKGPAAMHIEYPSGRPAFDFAQLFQEPELKTFEEREQEKKKNQEKALRRLGGLLDEARAFAQGRQASLSSRPDLALESLAPAARGQVPVVVRADTEADIRGAVAFTSARGLKAIIAGGADAWRCAALLKEKEVPVLLSVDRVPRREDEPYDAAYANAAALHRQGVRFAIVTDDASQSRNLPYEAAMARAYGLPAEAALRAITLSPAEIFGVADRLGSIEAGKAASLVLATGDIMDARTQVTRVWIDGRPQSLETRHTRLYQQFKDRK